MTGRPPTGSPQPPATRNEQRLPASQDTPANPPTHKPTSPSARQPAKPTSPSPRQAWPLPAGASSVVGSVFERMTCLLPANFQSNDQESPSQPNIFFESRAAHPKRPP